MNPGSAGGICVRRPAFTLRSKILFRLHCSYLHSIFNPTSSFCHSLFSYKSQSCSWSHSYTPLVPTNHCARTVALRFPSPAQDLRSAKLFGTALLLLLLFVAQARQWCLHCRQFAGTIHNTERRLSYCSIVIDS